MARGRLRGETLGSVGDPFEREEVRKDEPVTYETSDFPVLSEDDKDPVIE